MKKIELYLQKSLKYFGSAAFLCGLLLYNHLRIGGQYCFDLSKKIVSFDWVKISEIESISQFIDGRVLLKISFFCIMGLLLSFVFQQFGAKKARYYCVAAFGAAVFVDVLFYLTSGFYVVRDIVYITINLNSIINCTVGLLLGKGLFTLALYAFHKVQKRFVLLWVSDQVKPAYRIDNKS